MPRGLIDYQVKLTNEEIDVGFAIAEADGETEVNTARVLGYVLAEVAKAKGKLAKQIVRHPKTNNQFYKYLLQKEFDVMTRDESFSFYHLMG
jgi:hypothetical protein